MTPRECESFALMPFTEVRARLGSANVRLRLVRPAYAALGLGTLRVLRVRERSGSLEIDAGYDGYERIDANAESGRP